MGLRNNESKFFGILICIAFGLVILFSDLLISKVDKPLLEGTDLIDYQTDWTVTNGNRTYENVELPTYIEDAKLGDNLVLSRQLPETLENDTYIFFRASHQYVKAYINGHVVYSFGWDEKRLFGKSPGCTWVVIPISKDQAGDLLQIKLIGAYESYAGRINEFYMGDKSAVLYDIVSKRLGSIMLCFILVILGTGMTVFALVVKYRKATQSLLRLGLLSALIGVWSACTTNILQVVFSNVFFLLNLEFLTFYLILPVVLWFLNSIDYFKNRKVLNILFWMSLVLFLMLDMLQLLNIADYMETISAYHILMAATVLYLFITGFVDLLRKKTDKELRILIFSVLLIALFWSIDLIMFYVGSSYDNGYFTRIGMIVFIILWAVQIIRSMSQIVYKMTQTQLLEVLAYEDQMTGLKNRTAFEKKLNEYREDTDLEDAYIVEFDMNDLKNINDNFGHAKGDQAIITLANIIKTEFRDIGLAYRIGGDEICVIVPETEDISVDLIDEKMYRITMLVKAASREMKLQFSVASGYSKASGTENCDIDCAYKEADKKMYENKQRMKSCS